MYITYTRQETQQHNARSAAILRAADECKAANEKARQAEMAYRITLSRKPEDYAPSHGEVMPLLTDC